MTTAAPGLPQLTLRAIVLGVILAAVLAGANVLALSFTLPAAAGLAAVVTVARLLLWAAQRPVGTSAAEQQVD